MKISRRDLQLLIALGGVLLFLGLFFFVHGTFKDMSEELETEILTLTPQLDELRFHVSKEQTYLDETEVYKEYVNEQEAFYPVELKEEDILIWYLNFEDNLNTNFETIAFAQPILFSQFQNYVDIDGVSTNVLMSAYSTSSDTSMDFGYDGFKEALDYIYDSDARTSVENVALSYSTETALLTASLSMSKYYINYDGAEYVQSPMPQVPMGGITNLFGTATPVTP